MSDDELLAGFMDDYFAECDEHVTASRRLLLDLDRAVGLGTAPAAVLEDLFRAFHSIKGLSGMVELREAEMLAHNMESYLRALRQREVPLSRAGVTALIAGIDALERTIAVRRDGQTPPSNDAVLEQLAALLPRDAAPRPANGTAGPQRPPSASWKMTFTPSAALLARGINVDSVRNRLRAAGTIVDATPKVTPEGIAFEFLIAGEIDATAVPEWLADGVHAERIEAPPDAPEEPAPHVETPAEATRLATANVVRVDLARLDELMRLIGDLVISRARLEESLGRLERHVPPVEWRAVQENSQAIERQLRDLREGVMRVRLVRVGEIFRRMPFVVRDLATETGLKVHLEMRGQDTEIDKYLVERLMDPMLHLVRNAVSHGFEPPAERIAAGKPDVGTLVLSAAGVGDAVVLEVADDGRGIDVDAVAARGRTLGLPVPDGPLDPTTVLDLICAPGFSTREATDRASGRGVGMDVVRSTIQELNGTLAVETSRGEGTRFVIQLPLTLSIADALIATVGDRTFAIPQTAVREVIDLDHASLRRIERHELAPFRGGSLPILRLSRVFGIAERPGRALHVFVVGSGLEAVGIAVDRIVGQREIVVRSLADALIKVDGVAGATDLGDGRVVLILDVGVLARQAKRQASKQPAGRGTTS